jgi:hypothetical protein
LPHRSQLETGRTRHGTFVVVFSQLKGKEGDDFARRNRQRASRCLDGERCMRTKGNVAG